MSQNIEYKARCLDLAAAERIAIQFGARLEAVLEQTDTYFPAARGRLKVRRCDERVELIGYERSDRPDVRVSEYWVLPLPADSLAEERLAMLLGKSAVVKKTRRLLLWENVRIHLDRAENLGDFLELEGVVGLVDAIVTRQRVEKLVATLRPCLGEPIKSSYGEMKALE